MNPTGRIVSSTQVGRKVLGSANPLARGFRKGKQGCMDSVSGIFIGIILFMFAFWPAWCSVRGVEAVSKDIEGLPLLTADAAEGQSGLVKIQDEVGDIDTFDFDPDCGAEDEVEVFWYSWELKEYTTHMETRTRTETRVENGQDVEYEYEDEVEVEDWELIDSEEEIGDFFYLGNIEIRPRNAQLRFDDVELCEDKGREDIGEEWLRVEYLPVDNIDKLLVIGELDGEEIGGGDPFIISDQSPDELVSAMAGEEAGARLAWTIFAIVLFFISFNLIIGPLLFLLKYVPLIGPGLRFGIGIGSLILAIIWVMLLKFIIAFWWLIILIVIAVVVLLVMASKKKKDAADDVEEEEVVEEVQMLECLKCGEINELDAKFCANCGEPMVTEDQE